MSPNNFIDRRENRVSFWLYFLGLLFGVWGLWMHNSVAILLALILLGLGHILVRRKRKKEQAMRITAGIEGQSSTEQKTSRLAGGGVEALVSKPKVAKPLSSEASEEPEVYDFEEEVSRGDIHDKRASYN